MAVQHVVVVMGPRCTMQYPTQARQCCALQVPEGTADHFTQVATQLAAEFTIVTYDRRGNSRSPRPEVLTQTSVLEQAEDAAAVIQALQLAPVAVAQKAPSGPAHSCRDRVLLRNV